MRKIRVLIVDDSALIRQLLTELLSTDAEIEVVGTASDPYAARQRIKELHPDVLTLDVEMPKMDGLTFLEKLMTGHPMPVVMVSSLTEAGCQTTLKALELGAVDFFTKPKIDLRDEITERATELVDKVKMAMQARVRPLGQSRVEEMKSINPSRTAMLKTTDKILAIGASTGGTEAIRSVLQHMPADAPPILITQHMPERFTKAFADRLNSICEILVKEACDGDSVLPGQALVAPGNYHMELIRSGARYQVHITQGPPVNRHRPSVDVMFHSIAKTAGSNALGVILTGMGGDGAQGLLAMRQAGAATMAQDEATCVVFGMPKEAIKAGAVDKIVPLHHIPSALLTMLA
jgi:two-component system, chemotaxis family, protein-glutamate methylesterase/glutaminase